MIFIHLEVANTLKIEHEITIKNTEKFKQNMEHFLNDSDKNMILDLDEVMYINNSALGIIANFAIQARKEDKELVIAGIEPNIVEIFKIVKFDTFIKLFKTRNDAIQYFLMKK